MIGIRTTGIHAPIVNFEMITTIMTMNVAIAPNTENTTEIRQLFSRSFR